VGLWVLKHLIAPAAGTDSAPAAPGAAASAAAADGSNPFGGVAGVVDPRLLAMSSLLREAGAQALFNEVITFHGTLLCGVALRDLSQLLKRYIVKASLEYRSLDA
jgi:hypothetical protein